MSAAPARKTVDVDGLPVGYLEAGAGETILFLHGAGGAPPEGASFVPMLAERHRLLVPSRPGFDDTPLGRCAGPADEAELIAGFIERVAPGAVHVVAQSAGAAVGCWLAVGHPALVAHLVLSAPSTFAARRPAADGAPPDPESLAKLLYGETPAWSAPPGAAERERIARNARGYLSRTPAADGNRDLMARLPEISALTLLLLGTADGMLAPESVLPFQRHIPRLHRVYIYGAAHELPIAAGPQWVRLVSDFVARGEAFVVNAGGS